eukprot:m.23398 g.23398  ORF g.23398 m.23398 type:complete len:80 (-) comp7494_c0_seq4:2205-2444(-)
MTTTLMRINQHMKNPKTVIWAHNSHIGDSTGTSRGGQTVKSLDFIPTPELLWQPINGEDSTLTWQVELLMNEPCPEKMT